MRGAGDWPRGHFSRRAPSRDHGAWAEGRDRARLHQRAYQRGLGQAQAHGMVLGRPKVTAKNLRLDLLAGKINMYLEKKIDKRSIAKLLDVSPNILYCWLKARRPVEVE